MDSRDLLIEIGTEELPPKSLAALSEAFCRGVQNQLKDLQLQHDDFIPFATPRRLGMIISTLKEQQDPITVEKYGPAVKAAFDDEGKPTRAAQGFAQSCGVDVSELEQRSDGKVDKLFFFRHNRKVKRPHLYFLK